MEYKAHEKGSRVLSIAPHTRIAEAARNAACPANAGGGIGLILVLAIAFVLANGAVLLSTAYLKLVEENRTLDTESVISARLALLGPRYKADDVRTRFWHQLVERIQALPGVTHAAITSKLPLEGGSNTNVVPGKVVLKLDRRMIPEENPAEVEAALRQTIAQAAASFQPPRGGKALKVEVRRMLLANAMVPLAGNQPLVQAIQKHGGEVFGEPIPAVGTPLYTDVRLYVERGIPGVIYGAGPRTILEANAHRADERVKLDDVVAATKVIALTLRDLLVS